MRTLFFGLAVLVCVGCQDFNDALQSQRKPAAPPGINSTANVDDVQQAGDGANLPSTSQTTTKQATVKQPNVSPATGTIQKKSRQVIIGKTTAKIVDANEFLKNPKVIVVENKVSGSDPFTIAASAYVSATSRASAANFKRQLDIIKATNGRYPTYGEYMQLATQLRIEFAMLPPYQMYGYDPETGGLVVLEDKAEKIRRYEERGIRIDEEDKQ